MKPVAFIGHDVVLGAPAGWDAGRHGECDGLPVKRQDGKCISIWEFDGAERAAVAHGAPIVLTVFSGATQPPVMLTVGPAEATRQSGGNPHLVDGHFQSDKYPTTPRGKVPLSTGDPMAQDLLWQYAQRRRAVDGDFSDALEQALRTKGYDPARGARLRSADMPCADAVVEYGPGWIGPAMLHYATEDGNPVQIARAAGFECLFVTMEEELGSDHELVVDHFEYGAGDSLEKWTPADQGDGWRLVGKNDSEDGPMAMFVRPLKTGGGA